MTPDQGSAEKTEKATPKKREDARKKGQVRKSAEVNTAVTTLSMFLALFLFGGWMATRMRAMMMQYFGQMDWNTAEVSQRALHNQFIDGMLSMALILMPLLAAALLMGVVSNLMQVGFLFVTEPLKPKFSKINPIEGLKRIFSVKSIVEMVKAITKITAVALVVYFEYIQHFPRFPGMMEIGAEQATSLIFEMAIAVAFRAALVLVVIGLADYLYQWYDYEKKLRMTKQEVKQEFKQMEGDPQIKSKRKEIARKLSMMRMMQSIPEADVVITNPTHYAVALKYDAEEAVAPEVLAKGKDIIAQRIKEAAKEHKIEIVENKPVAQALYVACEVGQKIPPELFPAVAEILAYVYSLRNPQPQPQPPPQKPQPPRRPRRAGGGS